MVIASVRVVLRVLALGVVIIVGVVVVVVVIVVQKGTDYRKGYGASKPTTLNLTRTRKVRRSGTPSLRFVLVAPQRSKAHGHTNLSLRSARL